MDSKAFFLPSRHCRQWRRYNVMVGGSEEAWWHVRGTLTTHKGPVHVARFNSTGKYILSGGADRQIHLFNATTASNDVQLDVDRSPVKSYAAHNGAILTLSIANDNASFASAGEDRTVLQWDVATGSIVRRFSSHTGTVHAVTYCGSEQHPNDVIAAAGFDGTLRFYDVRARGAWRPLMECKDAKDAVLCLCWHQTTVWTGSVDGVVRTYDLRAGQMREDTIDRPVTSLTPSVVGCTLLVTTLGSDGGGSKDSAAGRHIIIDQQDGSHLQTIEGGHNAKYRCRSIYTQNDACIVAGDEDGNLSSWDVVSGQSVKMTEPSRQPPHQKAILWTERASCSEDRMLTASADGTIKIWSR